MDFTGERFIPNVIDDPELEVEHLQRYHSISDLVKDKVVVDAACGEGYGSFLLSQHAKSVFSIDIDAETIRQARTTYGKENLNFLQGSIEQLPIDDSSVDVFVSFETIEHVSEHIQHTFLKEITRVLKDDGVLVISTPNKRIYSDLRNYKNEFHVKEFYYQEFLLFLRKYFPHIELYNQRFEVASIMSNANAKSLDVVDWTSELTSEGKYCIAVCSKVRDRALTPINSVVNDHSNKLRNMIDRIMQLQGEVSERNAHIQSLDAEIKHKDTRIVQLQDEVEERNSHITMLDSIINMGNINKDDEHLEVLNVLNARIDNLQQTLANKEQALSNKEAHINSLLGQERILHNILRSHGWRILKRYYRMRDSLVPSNSRRQLLAKVLVRLIREPQLTFRMVNRNNLKKFLYHRKTGSFELLENRVMNYIDRHTEEETPKLQINLDVDMKETLVFEPVDNPDVSIVIPVYNQWHYTYSCLASILRNTQDVSYEVIVADDLSTDETVNIHQYVQNINVIRDNVNRGFLLNCNNAAKVARGKYILLLNNDTNVQPEWLKSLVDLIDHDPKIGMVGSKLVYSDGRLQEAGGIIWRDASGWNFGRLDDPDKSEYNYVKKVDYISGACIMIRSKLWNKIGGFDERYAPAYFEDSDLAFEVRRHGFQVVYQPKSVVVHFEGISHGTDTSSGVKSYQVLNKNKFIEKWRTVLDEEHFENAEHVFLARDRTRNQKTIVVIDHYVPHFDRDAGSRTVYQYIKLFVDMGLNVKFIGDNFFRHEPYTSDLQSLGVEVLYGNWYANHVKDWIKTNGGNIDYVFLNRPHISEKYIDYVRNHTRAKVIYYGHDLHFLRESREYELTGNAELRKSSRRWRAIETQLFDKSDAIYYPSQVEVDEIKTIRSGLNVKAIPAYLFENMVSKEMDFDERKDLLFVGGFAHKPNIDAVLWFVENVFPYVLAKHPDMKFYVVGSNPPDSIQRLNSPNIIVTGFVSDEELQQYYDSSRIVVAPLRYGAGVKGKIVEAMYNQVPIVTTTIGAEGLPDAEKYLFIEDAPERFADAIVRHYYDSNGLKQLSSNYCKYVDKYFTPEAALKIIRQDIAVESQLQGCEI